MIAAAKAASAVVRQGTTSASATDAHTDHGTPRPRLAQHPVRQPRPGAGGGHRAATALGRGLGTVAQPDELPAGRTLWRCPGRNPGCVSGPGARFAGVGVHPRRLVACARQVRPQLRGTGLRAGRRHGGGAELQPVPGGDDRADRHADHARPGQGLAQRAALWRRPQPHHGGGPFGRWPPGGHVAGLPLEDCGG
jgi:hypothetical protein